jgi:hypothetical protein
VFGKSIDIRKVTLLVGIVVGISMEKSGTTDALVNLGTQVERIQTPAAVPLVAAKKTRK